MKKSIIKKKWKSVYEMYLENMQTHTHHSCILSRHVKSYKNLQCVADRNKKSGANTTSTSGITTADQGKELQLYLLPQALAVLQGHQVIVYADHFTALFQVCILCLYTVFGQDQLKIINNYNN